MKPLNRTIESYAACDPALMAKQSEAAIFHAFSDMKKDIATLAAEAASQSECGAGAMCCYRAAQEDPAQAAPQTGELTDIDLRIVYTYYFQQGAAPHGIRDRRGYLLFFPEIRGYDGQGERYKEETDRQHRLAKHLLKCLTPMAAEHPRSAEESKADVADSPKNAYHIVRMKNMRALAIKCMTEPVGIDIASIEGAGEELIYLADYCDRLRADADRLKDLLADIAARANREKTA